MDKTKATALIGASLCGKSECVKALLAAGAEVNHENIPGMTALHMAAIRGHADCVKLLIDAGADLYKKANDGRTALDLAVESENEDCVKLLKKTTDTTSTNKTEKIDDKACKLYKELFAIQGMFVVGDSFDSDEEVDDDSLRKHPGTRMIREHLRMGRGPESFGMLSLAHMEYDRLALLRFCLAAGAEVYKDKASGEVMVNLPKSEEEKPVDSPQIKIKKAQDSPQLPQMPNKKKKHGDNYAAYILITLVIAIIVAYVVLVM